MSYPLPNTAQGSETLAEVDTVGPVSIRLVVVEVETIEEEIVS